MKNIIAYEGELDLNGLKIPCYILTNGTRLLSARAMQNALKMSDEGNQETGDRVARYLTQKSLQPFIYKDKKAAHFEPIICYKGESKIGNDIA